MHAWHAEGYRSIGVECLFHAPAGARPKRDILTLFGQQITEDSTGAIETGGRAEHYHHEVHIDKGAHPRAEVWSSRLPHTPPVVRPAHIIPADAAANMARSKFDLCGDKPLVLLFPFADWNSRCWPFAHWVDLAWSLKDRGIATAALTNDDRSRRDACQAFPFFFWGQPWTQVAALMKLSAAVVGNDSGPSHVAGTLGVRTFALMGATSRIFTHCPEVTELAVSKAELKCVGCHFDRQRGYRRACDVQCQALMRLTPETVLEQVVSAIGA